MFSPSEVRPQPRETLAAFVGLHLPQALAAARRAAHSAGVRDDDLVHEAAHASVTEAWRVLEGREEAWPAPVAVRTIAHRRALDLVRRRRGRERREQALAARDLPDAAPGPALLAEKEELRALVRAAVEALPAEEQRWVTALALNDGPTAAALALGMPKSSFRSRVERVCEGLRRRLKPLATAGVVACLTASALAPFVHESVGTFAIRAERPGTSALLVELRAEAAHYRATASPSPGSPPASTPGPERAPDVETHNARATAWSLAAAHSGTAYYSTI